MEKTRIKTNMTCPSSVAAPIYLYGATIKITQTSGEESYVKDVEELEMQGRYKREEGSSRYAMEGGGVTIKKTEGKRIKITNVAELYVTPLD